MRINGKNEIEEKEKESEQPMSSDFERTCESKYVQDYWNSFVITFQMSCILSLCQWIYFHLYDATWDTILLYNTSHLRLY